MTSSCAWAYALPISGPALAFLYSFAVLFMFAFFHECKWTAMPKQIMLRLTVLVAALASSVALCEKEVSVTKGVVPVGVAFWIVSIGLIYASRLYDVEGGPPPKLDSDIMRGKVVLVTGGNAGIGRETVRQLVSLGATVVLACRSESRAKDAMDDILSSLRTEKSRADVKSRMRFVPLDLSDFDSVKGAVNLFLEFKLPLHVLINNAGIMMGSKKVNKDGYELTLTANHLGHFLLTVLLLPKILETDDARVITVTSSTFALARYGFDFEDMFCESTREYSLFGQYAQTKLANILFTKELAKRYPQMHSFAVHPGLVRTDVVRNMQWWLRFLNTAFASIIATLQKRPPQGAYTSVWCAASPAPPLSGAYLLNCQVAETNAFAKNMEDAKRLWEDIRVLCQELAVHLKHEDSAKMVKYDREPAKIVLPLRENGTMYDAAKQFLDERKAPRQFPSKRPASAMECLETIHSRHNGIRP